MCTRQVLIVCIIVVAAAGSRASTAATFVGLGEDVVAIGGISANGQWVVGSRELPLEQQPACPPNADCALGEAPFVWSLPTGSQFIEQAGFRHGLAISNDGRSIAGSGRAFDGLAQGPFLWTSSQGVVDLGELPGVEDRGYGIDVSADGTVVVGGVGDTFFGSAYGSPIQAFRWTAGAGMQGLGDLNGGAFRSFATAVSPDGQVVVGEATSFGDVGGQAFRWTEETGMVGLGFFEDRIQSTARDVSSDGNVVVGYGYGLLADPRAFRWTPETGMAHLNFQVAEAVTGNGRTIVGSSQGAFGGTAAVIWNAESGIRDLREFLIDEHDLAQALAGWQLTSALDISADGRTIVGLGENPAGYREAWVFTTHDVQPLAGDFNGDGIVDPADYVMWRKNFGSQAGFAAWLTNFGQSASDHSNANASPTVPEPASTMLLIVAAAGMSTHRYWPRKRITMQTRV
jgi:probable HAF family extracellular repeat protein